MADYVTNPCLVCGAPTTVLASHYKRGRGRTCSRECSSQRAEKAKWQSHYLKFEQTFWSRVDQRGEDDCWPWTGSRYPTGYGRFKSHRRQVLAHRFALESRKGAPSNSSLFALHSCDNPICCNPSHLRWGTPKDNTRDCLDRGRFRSGSPRKIDLTQLLEMKGNGMSNAAIARHFKTHPSSVARATLRALEAKEAGR